MIVTLHCALLLPSCAIAVTVTVPCFLALITTRTVSACVVLFSSDPESSQTSTVAISLFEVVQITVGFVIICVGSLGVSVAVSVLLSGFVSRSENDNLFLSNVILSTLFFRYAFFWILKEQVFVPP